VTSKKPKTASKPKPGQVFGSGGVSYRFPNGFEGQIQVNVDFSQVPPPTQYYYVDSLHLRVDKEQHMAILSFGQRNENTDRFTTSVDVVMPASSLFGTFWASSRPVEATLDQLLRISGITGEVRPISPPDTRALTLFANLIFAAVGEGETTLDFYHLSPREVFLAKTQRTDMHLQPTIRVIMSSALTKYFFDTLRPYPERIRDNESVLERNRSAARSR
jgi:hypothetical protein